jgi:hypothetical protein
MIAAVIAATTGKTIVVATMISTVDGATGAGAPIAAMTASEARANQALRRAASGQNA